MTATDQWALGFFADNGSNNHACVAKNDKVIASLFGGAIEFEGHRDSFDADGFNINMTTAPAAVRETWWLATDSSEVKVGTTLSRTGVGTQAITGCGFQPDAVIIAATDSTSLGSINTGGAAIAVGAADNAEQYCAWAKRSGTDHWHSSRYDNNRVITWAIDASGPGNAGAGLLATASLQSLDADGFTLNFNTQDGVARYFHWIAIGNADVGRIVYPSTNATFFQPTTVEPRGLFTYGDSQTTQNTWVFGASFGIGVADCLGTGRSGSFQCVDASSPTGSRYAVRDSETQPFGCFRHRSVAGSADTQLNNRLSVLACYPVDVGTDQQIIRYA
jgi:hypothetical protein